MTLSPQGSGSVDFLKRTWAEIDLDGLAHNFNIVKKAVPSARIMAVVKADAYGHGDSVLTGELERLGADAFAVSNLEEALHVRLSGTKLPILILGVTPVQFANVLAQNNISQTVFSTDYAKKLSESAKKLGVTVDCHINTDSGMGRLGFDVMCDQEKAAAEIENCIRLDNLNFSGIFTHFAEADSENGREYTQKQYSAFCDTVEALKNKGITFDYVHSCNSAGIMTYPEMHGTAVRAGIILYGLDPAQRKTDFVPVMELKSIIAQLRLHKKGSSIGYGRTHTLERDTLVATIPVGYADGYPRKLSNTASVLVNGKRAKILGRVCMDQMMVDVTDIQDVTEESVVTLFGRDNGEFLGVDELAMQSETINYELVCLVGKRVPRVYLKNGKPVAIVDMYNNTKKSLL